MERRHRIDTPQPKRCIVKQKGISFGSDLQASGANPGGLSGHKLRKLFVFNASWSQREVLHGNCGRFCDGQILRFQQLSTPENFLQLNLKEFYEENRVEPLVPNQIPILIELCGILWFSID